MQNNKKINMVIRIRYIDMDKGHKTRYDNIAKSKNSSMDTIKWCQSVVNVSI